MSYYDQLMSGPAPETSGNTMLDQGYKTGLQDKYSEGASFSAMSDAASVDDLETKVRILAENRGLPVDRYRIEQGDIQFQGDDGAWYSEHPEGTMLKQFGANVVGHSAPIIGSIAGGAKGAAVGGAMAGPPGMVAGGLLGAFTGGAAGEGVRKGAGYYVEDEPVEPLPLALNMAKEGGLGAAGEIPGFALNRVLRAKRLRGDLKGFDIADTETQGLSELAQQYGIALTPGEVAGSRSLINRQSLFRDLPETSDLMEKFYTSRNQQVGNALYKFLDTVSSTRTPHNAFVRGTKAADKAIEGMKTARTEAVSPFYQMAENQTANIRGVIDNLSRHAAALEGTKTGKLLIGVRKSLMSGDDPKTFIGQIHEAKMDIDDLISTAKRKGARNKVRTLMGVKSELTDTLTDASKAYKAGEKLYQRLSGPIQRTEESLVGKLAGMTADPFPNLSRVLFSKTSSPQAVKQAKRVINAYDPTGGTWDGVIRGHIQTVFEDIASSSVDEASNLGGVFRKKLIGTVSRERMLMNALDGQQFMALQDMMDVFKATGRAMKGQSTTVPRAQQLKQLEREAIAPAAKAISPINYLDSVLGWVTDARTGKYAEQFAKVLTDDKLMNNLKGQAAALRKLSPQESAFLPTLTNALTMMSGAQFEDLE